MRRFSPSVLARVVAGAAALVIGSYARTARADPPAVHATRGTPAVDGSLDDPAWSRASWSPPFLQRSPELGARAAHRTRARILYDDRALYVAVECETRRRPDARVARRDTIPEGERIRVLIDARGEGDTAFNFQVNPAGVEADSIVEGDDNEDPGWDSVWDAEVRVSDHGWVAEYRIPWRVLRFDAHNPRFRIQIERLDFEDGETVALVPIAPDSAHYVAGFAPLEDIAGVRPARIFEFAPYVSGRVRALRDPTLLSPLPTLSGSLGADVKLGLSQDLVLDATLNPDFGTVEVDPSVINLSTFETYYNERRPFFLEGADIFQTPLQLLYTRRIGAPPSQPFALHSNGIITTLDPNAPVWGAAKISGRIGDLSVMLLEGLTGPAVAHESYPIRQTGVAGRGPSLRLDGDDTRIAAPTTNWLAARVRGSIGPGSTVGAIVTHVGRIGQPNDLVGGVDWDWRAPDGIHRFRGQVAATEAWNPSRGTHSGQAIWLEASRSEDRVFLWNLRMRAYTRDFDPNGLGYLDRADGIIWQNDLVLRLSRPTGPFRSAYISSSTSVVTNTEGLLIDGSSGFDFGAVLRSQWSVLFGIYGIVPHFDDRETRGGIPYLLNWQAQTYANLNSDPRKPVRVSIAADMTTQNGGYRTNLEYVVTWLPTTFLRLQVSGALRLVTDVPRWVTTDLSGTGQPTYVFGHQYAHIFDNSLRVALAFNRQITLDVYSQLLYGQVQYVNYDALTDPATLTPYVPSQDYSFDRLNVTINAIARYEYQRGAFLSLVLLHREEVFSDAGTAGYGTGLGIAGFGRPDTEILAKLTYLIL